jgi:hypothetical protein
METGEKREPVMCAGFGTSKNGDALFLLICELNE